MWQMTNYSRRDAHASSRIFSREDLLSELSCSQLTINSVIDIISENTITSLLVLRRFFFSFDGRVSLNVTNLILNIVDISDVRACFRKREMHDLEVNSLFGVDFKIERHISPFHVRNREETLCKLVKSYLI